jgi:8-amino-7-oxononanoate synthase
MNQTKILSIQRRDFPRYKTDNSFQLTATTTKNTTPIKGETINISQHGVSVKLASDIAISERVVLEFCLHGSKNVLIKGRIIWSDPKLNLYGIDFSEYKETISEYWTGYIAGVNSIAVDRRDKRDRRKSQEEKNQNIRKNERRETKSAFLPCLKFDRIKKFQKENLYCYLREFQSATGSNITLNGKKFIMFASNNYLGLANHPEVVETMIKTAEKYGAGSGGSRILCGTMDLHNELERKLATFVGGEDCILYSTGYDANLGLISALLDKNGYVIVDESSHASIVDGGLLANAKIEVFRHNDVKSLENKLKKIDYNAPKIIATEGVFSMDGDICNLPEIYELGEKYNSAILLDEAHSLGILGQHGKGTVEYFGLNGDIELTVGTMSKALGCIGGYVVANKNIIHYLKHTSKSFLFTTSLSPAIIAAIIKSLDLITTKPEIREDLWRNINYAKKRLIDEGFNVGDTKSSIIPVILGDERLAHVYVKELEKVGIYVAPAVFPAVKRNEARLRVGIMATHNIEDIEFLIESLLKIRKKLKI